MNGNQVDPYSLVDLFYKERSSTSPNLVGQKLKTYDQSATLKNETISNQSSTEEQHEEEVLKSILADMDPL